MIKSKETLVGTLNITTEKVLPELEDITIIPTTEQKVYTHENSYGYDKVTVEAIPPITLQDKEVTPSKEVQTITSDENYDGLNQVTINPIPNNYIEPSGALEITENGTYDVKEYAEVTTSIGGSGKYAPRFISFANYTGTELDSELANLDLSNIKNLESIFDNCVNLTTAKLTGTITNSISAKRLFAGGNLLTHVDLSELYVTVSDASQMFYWCEKLQYLDVSGMTFSNISTSTSSKYQYMLGYVPTSCEIIVKDDTEKAWFNRAWGSFTNIKTKAEKEAE